MNYWPAEAANLAECHVAVFRSGRKPASRLAQGDGRRRQEFKTPAAK
jgi:hypothetical protein